MEILYLWIENYRNIKNQGFNFSSKWKFDYQNEQLTVEERPDAIDNFFGEDIVNLTALIGANGCGKTSVLEFLYEELFNHHINKFSIHKQSQNILQIPNSSSFFVINNINSDKESEQINNLKIKPNSFHYTPDSVNLLRNHQSLFYSPFLTKHNNRTYTESNLTTRALLQRGKEINSISYGGEVSAYELKEDINLIKFLDFPFNKNELPFSLLSKKVSLKYNFVKNRSRQFQQTKTNLDNLNILKDAAFLNNLTKHIFNSNTKNEEKKFYFLKSTIINLLQCISDCLNRIRRLNIASILSKKSFLPQDRQYIYQEYESLVKNSSTTNTNLSNSIPLLKDYLTGILTDEFSTTIDFFLQLIDDENGNNNTLFNTIAVTKTQALEVLEKYQPLYFKLIISFFEKNFNEIRYKDVTDIYIPHFKFIDFDVEGMSSGERLLSQLFARLNSASSDIKKSACKSLTILIDEGETSLHPQWQKQYIKLLKETLPLIFENTPIQIILTSHSPFIVSDLPKENIIFLDTDKNNKTIVVDGLKQKETFGANIHTLFTDAFFMAGGLMGDFAKEKINAVIKYLNEGASKENPIKTNEQAQQYINLIGEPIIKRQLQKMLDSKRLTKADDNEKNIDEMKQTLNALKEQVRLLENQINPLNDDSDKS